MTTYYEDENIRIRSMVPEDAKVIFDTYQSYGWEPSMDYIGGEDQILWNLRNMERLYGIDPAMP